MNRENTGKSSRNEIIRGKEDDMDDRIESLMGEIDPYDDIGN